MNAFLSEWSNFYVITGSSAGALTGLTFVVITLVAGQERTRPELADGVEVFSSPTVVHFCAALLLSAVFAAPWHRLLLPGVVLLAVGVAGVAYAGRIMSRLARLRHLYVPEFDDWVWYAVMPLVGYGAILASGVLLQPFARPAMFVVAAAVVLLIFVGIRNAWDTVTFIAVTSGDAKRAPD